MVLINNLTIDEINAALLHLQRAKTEVVGGTKGSTVQNITISNKGGGSTVDYAPTISALSNRIDKNTDDIESVEDEIDKIQETLEQLSDNGISSMTFDPVTRQLQINTQNGEVYSCDITSENITLNFDATTNKLTLEMGEQYQEVTLPYINANEKGSANGVATLDSSGRVPYSQLPESAMEFLGNWNASTNTPHLQDGTGTNGDFYVCNVGGTVTFGTGNTQTFVPNDRVIYNGASSQWVKLPAGQVSSVNGMSGDVTLDADDIEYSTGVTVKQKIDANAPVQADWTQTNSSSKDFIKNKIPIWITNGSADDNMSPIDSVTDGSMRPVTSNAVANAIAEQNNVVIKTKPDQYTIRNLTGYGIDLQNSDIVNFNGLWSNDFSEAGNGEGINFLRSNANWDSLFASEGKLYFEKNLNRVSQSSSGVFEIPTLVKTDASVTNIIKKYYTLGDLKIVLMQANVTYQTSNPSGAIYYAMCSSIPFPITFTNKPTISMFTEYNGGNAWCWGATRATTTETGAYYIARGSNTTVSVIVHIIAIGE